ncbi:MAG: alpha/beta hydrolase [Muribaculaceae bacterium]|nr:alpha/beta hydrolase [Muribaculaceae bacterium]
MKAILRILLLILPLTLQAADYAFVRNIAYRPNSTDSYADEMCRLDVAYIPGATDCDVVVWYHGGGLTGGQRDIPSQLLTDSLIVVGVEYRLSPKVTIDEIIDDAAASTAWVVRNIKLYGGNPDRVFLSGHSAGGYLIDMIGLDKSRLEAYGIDANSIAGIAPFSGQCITHYEARARQGIPPLQPTIDRLAPLYHVRADAPPMLILSGDREHEMYGRYEEQAYFWRMLRLTGHPDVTLIELPGTDHGSMVSPGFPHLLHFIHRLPHK